MSNSEYDPNSINATLSRIETLLKEFRYDFARHITDDLEIGKRVEKLEHAYWKFTGALAVILLGVETLRVYLWH